MPPAHSPNGLPLAVVVGGCGGMGLACVRRLAQHHAVMIADIDFEKSTRIAAELREEGLVVIPNRCDATDPASIADLIAQASRIGKIQTLCHVLGLSPSMAGWRRIMTVNLIGAALMAEAALPAMAPEGVGLFVASMAAHVIQPDAAMLHALDNPLVTDFLAAIEAAAGCEPTSGEAYGLSKLGMIRLCRRLASRWGEQSVRILSLSPGLIETPMGLLESSNNPGKQGLVAKTPLRRQGSLTEIIDAVEFLCSERASFITGTDLLVDGGLAAGAMPLRSQLPN